MKIIAIIFLSLGILSYMPPVIAGKAENCCVQGDCKKERKEEKKPGNVCNPFFACTCCYYIKSQNTAVNCQIQREKDNYPVSINSSVIAGHVFQCWHPPEVQAAFQ